MSKLKEIIPYPASIEYIDDVKTEFTASWGVQLFIRSIFDTVEGVGEVLVYGSGALRSYLGVLEDVVIPYAKSSITSIEELIKSNTEELRHQILKLVDTMEKLLFTAGNCSVTLGAIGGFEMSLWDAIAKAKDRTLASLIGSIKRDRVKVYASFPRYNSIEKILKAVDLAQQRGFLIVKLHEKPNIVVEAMKEIRKTLGYEMGVSIDLNAPFENPDDAVNFINSIHKYEPVWVEEPTWPPYDYKKLEIVASKSPIAIGAGENSYTIQDFESLVKTGVKYLQPDISKVGGLARFTMILDRIRSLKTKEQTISPHLRPHRSIIAHLFTVHVAAVHEEISSIEWPLAPPPTDLFDGEIGVKKGEVSLPRKTGLGVTLNFDLFVSKYKYYYVPRFLKYSNL